MNDFILTTFLIVVAIVITRWLALREVKRREQRMAGIFQNVQFAYNTLQTNNYAMSLYTLGTILNRLNKYYAAKPLPIQPAGKVPRKDETGNRQGS